MIFYRAHVNVSDAEAGWWFVAYAMFTGRLHGGIIFFSCRIIISAYLLPDPKVRNKVNHMTHSTAHSQSDILDFIISVKDDPGAYFEYVHDEEHFEMAFWASSEQQELAIKFGEIIVLETSALTSRCVSHHVGLMEWDLPACAPSETFGRKNAPPVRNAPLDTVCDNFYARSPKR